MYDFNIKDVVSHGLKDIDSILKVNWELTPHCNYKCSYCFGNLGLPKNANFSSIDDLKKAVDKLLSINRKYYNILLIGGEPTIHPHFLDLLKYFNSLNKNISLSIVSNGSRSIQYHNELFSSIKDKNLVFNISVHLEHANLNHIKEVIKLANEYNVYVILSFMIHPEKQKLLDNFLSEFIDLRQSYYFDIIFMELRQPPYFDRNDYRYTEDHYKWIDNSREKWKNVMENSNAKKIEYFSGIKNYGYSIQKDYKIIDDIDIEYGLSIRNGLKAFKGFYCFGGSNFINIHPDFNYDGSIQCPKFTNMGNLLDSNNELNFKFEICDQFQCGCNSNDIIPKFRNIKDASNFINDNIKYFQPFLIKKIIESKSQSQDIDNNINSLDDNINNFDSKIINLDNKINKLINNLAWWIPIRKWRDNFRNKMLNTDQTRPDQTRPDQTRPDQTGNNICSDYIYIYNNSKYKKLQPMLQYYLVA